MASKGVKKMRHFVATLETRGDKGGDNSNSVRPVEAITAILSGQWRRNQDTRNQGFVGIATQNLPPKMGGPCPLTDSQYHKVDHEYMFWMLHPNKMLIIPKNSPAYNRG